MLDGSVSLCKHRSHLLTAWFEAIRDWDGSIVSRDPARGRTEHRLSNAWKRKLDNVKMSAVHYGVANGEREQLGSEPDPRVRCAHGGSQRAPSRASAGLDTIGHQSRAQPAPLSSE